MTSTGHEERLFTGYTGRLSIILAIGWMTILLGRNIISPLLPAIIDDLGILPSQAGIALTAMFGCYALAHYPGGRLSDQLSRRTVIVGGLGLTILGLILLIRSTDFGGFLFGVLLIGAGSGIYLVPMRALLSDLFTERRGQAFGVSNAAGMVGNILAAGAAVAAISILTWRAGFFPPFLTLLVVVIAFHHSSREPYSFSRVSLDIRTTISRVFGDRYVRHLVVAHSLITFTWVGFLSFLPTYLQLEKGFSPVMASTGFALFFIIGAGVMPIVGYLSDRFDPLVVVISVLPLALLGLCGVLVSASPLMAMGGIALFAAGLTTYPPVMQSHLMDTFPNANMGGDFGAYKTMYSGTGSLGPAYVGFVAEKTTYGDAFAGFILCLIGSLVLVGWLTRQ
jgi:MFS family permease